VSPLEFRCYHLCQLSYTSFHMHFRLQAAISRGTAIFNCSPTLTLSCTNIRPAMFFDSKDMHIPLKFYISYISNVRFKCFRFPVGHFDFRLNSHRILHRAMLLSAAVTLAPSKTNVATLNLLPKVIYAL